AAGYRVLDAFSGPESLEVLRRERPDAMLLDVRMPGMTGYEVCRKVREDPEFAALPVIMVTALSQPEERIMGIEAGATDFISKPFNKKELLARVRASLMMARYGKSGIVPQLPGAVVIADPDWRILASSPQAIVLLGIPSAGAMQYDFTQFLEQAEKDSVSAGEEPAEFLLHFGKPIKAWQVAVRDPNGRIILRLITLSESPPG
ncbi:MAG TPA: response regulator, partial [Gallionella sp.]|nr:response regulator [Gallionella sp.]